MLYVSVFVPAEARNKREMEREGKGEVEGERGTKKEAQNPHGVRNKTHVMKELSPNNVPQTGSFTVYHLPLFFFLSSPKYTTVSVYLASPDFLVPIVPTASLLASESPEVGLLQLQLMWYLSIYSPLWHKIDFLLLKKLGELSGSTYHPCCSALEQDTKSLREGWEAYF